MISSVNVTISAVSCGYVKHLNDFSDDIHRCLALIYREDVNVQSGSEYVLLNVSIARKF